MVQTPAGVNLVGALPQVPTGFTPAQELQAILELTNKHRAVGAACGGTYYPPVAPVTWDEQLAQSAQAYVTRQATREFTGHIDPDDGSTPQARNTAVGYTGTLSGENLAYGLRSARVVVDAWLGSEYHCKVLMSREYTVLGVAVAARPESKYGLYWAQNFGRR